MAKTKRDPELYTKMRDHGLRKRVARELSELPAHASDGKQAPKPLREAVERLDELVQELKRHIESGTRKTAARKAARTRSDKAAGRSAAARKAARTRVQGARAGRAAESGKSRTGASAAKSRSGASAAKRRPRTSR